MFPSILSHQGGPGHFLTISIHEETPDLSYSPVSIINDNQVFILPSKELTRIHGKYHWSVELSQVASPANHQDVVHLGVLMLLSWPLAAACGIFMSMWMKPALPRGEWFEVSSLVSMDYLRMRTIIVSIIDPLEFDGGFRILIIIWPCFNNTGQLQQS